jgi:hypothetical protein
MRTLSCVLLILVVLTSFMGMPSVSMASPMPQSQKWSFGVITDTQWMADLDDNFNPETSSTYIIAQINQQFIQAGVKFVVAPGDLVEVGEVDGMGIRALYTQDLYNAGIGFYPLRGNHEIDLNLISGTELRHAFPQIVDGVNNNTPADITTALIPAVDLLHVPPVSKTGDPFSVGSNFTEPTDVNTANHSVSYAFQYNNATFMLLDQFDADNDYCNSTIAQQQGWIDTTLSARPAKTHAFVFAHKNILGGKHKDNLFGCDLFPTDITAGEDPGDGNGMVIAKLTPEELETLTVKQMTANKFLASMQTNQVDYVFTGHDHHHWVSVVISPDGRSKIRQVIGQSASLKFYPPGTPVSTNNFPIEQDLDKVGYYIFTVDGPRVVMDYYASTPSDGIFNFVKISSNYYSLNGKEKLVAQRGSYNMSDDTTVAETFETGFKRTRMAILAGTNYSTAITSYGKAINNNVNTAWRASDVTLFSDILTLSGMSRTLGGTLTDTYVLSMSYTARSSLDPLIRSGQFSILTRDNKGKWGNAVKKNFGGVSKFIYGPWNSTYPLGSYGVDPATKTAWAVLNYNGDFAVGINVSRQFMPFVVRYYQCDVSDFENC